MVGLRGNPTSADIGGERYKFGDYGFGRGPVYMSGELSTQWYSGETAYVLVDPSYQGDITVQLRARGGSGTGAFTTPPFTEVSGAGGWRFTSGTLSVDRPGCWELQATGQGLDESIIFQVNPGKPPPG